MPLMVRGEAVPLLFSCLLYIANHAGASCSMGCGDIARSVTPIRLATKLLRSLKATLTSILSNPA